MAAVYKALLVTGVLSLLAGMMAHFTGPLAQTSSRGFLSFGEACFLLAIAVAAGQLFGGGAGKGQEPVD
jgi:hypothetical protein